MESEDYICNWLRDMKNELDDTNTCVIYDTLEANHFTTRLKLKLITNEQFLNLNSSPGKMSVHKTKT